MAQPSPPRELSNTSLRIACARVWALSIASEKGILIIYDNEQSALMKIVL